MLCAYKNVVTYPVNGMSLNLNNACSNMSAPFNHCFIKTLELHFPPSVSLLSADPSGRWSRYSEIHISNIVYV